MKSIRIPFFRLKTQSQKKKFKSLKTFHCTHQITFVSPKKNFILRQFLHNVERKRQ